MAYNIASGCIGCDSCRPQCPTGAIGVDNGHYWINPVLCNNCEGHYDKPQCVAVCADDLPVPYQAKKGRAKIVDDRPATSNDLFLNGRNNPFSSAIVIWEACNLLSQRASLNWEEEDGALSYQRPVYQGRGLVTLRLMNSATVKPPVVLSGEKAIAAIESLDIRSACLNLIFAAHATALDRPWEQVFTIDDLQIESYLGLDKRKDLTKPAKLTLIKELVQQVCRVSCIINWSQQGRIRGFSVEQSPLWNLLQIKHHFQQDDLGCKHLVGLTFQIRAGMWTKYFLNRQGCKEQTAFYQYGTLPKSLLTNIMSIWQQHEGSARMMLWLLFKMRLGREQRITVPTLMRIAYGEERVVQAASQRDDRKHLLKTFENDLAVMSHYGLKPVFDPITYPLEIQPLWAKLEGLPEDADEAVEFWINDANRDVRLTDAGPRGKWNSLMNARILTFQLPPDWDVGTEGDRKRQRKSPTHQSGSSKRKSSGQTNKLKSVPVMSGEEIATARKVRGLSQRDLAERTGKSQSWIRDIENGRFRVKATDQALLRKVLDIG
jgi:DNA-binding transcriptional regulator YiaG